MAQRTLLLGRRLRALVFFQIHSGRYWYKSFSAIKELSTH